MPADRRTAAVARSGSGGRCCATSVTDRRRDAGLPRRSRRALRAGAHPRSRRGRRSRRCGWGRTPAPTSTRPSHTVAGGRTMADVGAGRARRRGARDPGAAASHDARGLRLGPAEAAAPICPSALPPIVIIDTGWARWFGDDAGDAASRPRRRRRARARRRGMRVLAVDTLSPDPTDAANSGFPVHEVVLGADRPHRREPVRARRICRARCGSASSRCAWRRRRAGEGRRVPARAIAGHRRRYARLRMSGRAPPRAPRERERMTLDVAALRASFPSLASGIAHFDGPGGTQTPAVVGAAIAATLTGPLSNRGTSIASERNADDADQRISRRDRRPARRRRRAASSTGAARRRSPTTSRATWPRPGRRATRSWSRSSTTTATCGRGSRRPRRAGVVVRWLRLDPATAELDLTDLAEVVSERTRLVAVTAASNLLGTHPAGRARSPRGRTRSAPWSTSTASTTRRTRTVDVAALGADFFVCSPYKFFGPHCAVLVAAPALLESLHARQAAAVDQRRARAVRARHAALRDHGRRHRRRRLHRRPRAARSAPDANGSSPPTT